MPVKYQLSSAISKWFRNACSHRHHAEGCIYTVFKINNTLHSCYINMQELIINSGHTDSIDHEDLPSLLNHDISYTMTWQDYRFMHITLCASSNSNKFLIIYFFWLTNSLNDALSQVWLMLQSSCLRLEMYSFVATTDKACTYLWSPLYTHPNKIERFQFWFL